MPDPRRVYRWNARAAQYIAPNGQFVSRRAVRDALDAAITSEATRMADLLATLRSGAIDLDAWYAGMRQSVKLVHLWAASAAKGGWVQLEAADYGRVGQTVRFHYDRLQRFALQLAQGLPLDGRAVVRVGMYAKAARQTYHSVELQVIRAAGFTEERNILHPTAEHCAECVAVSALQWVPVGTLPRLGTRICLTNDECHFDYR